MVYMLLILLLYQTKLILSRTKLKKYQTHIAYRVFLACEGTQDQNKKQGNKQAQHFELTLLSVVKGEFHNDGKDVSFSFLT